MTDVTFFTNADCNSLTLFMKLVCVARSASIVAIMAVVISPLRLLMNAGVSVLGINITPVNAVAYGIVASSASVEDHGPYG